jgi:hypothetical protein
MTLLTLCNNVLSETGFPQLSSIVGNTDPQAVQILALANRALRSVSREYDWRTLETDYTINVVAGTSVYALPADYYKMAMPSLYDSEQYFTLKGGMDVQRWQQARFGMLTPVIWPQGFRIVAEPVFDPEEPPTNLGKYAIALAYEPTANTSVQLIYYSSNLAFDSTDQEDQAATYIADTYKSKVPEDYVELDLMWRFRRAKGLDFSAERAERDTTLKSEYAKSVAPGDIPVGGPAWDYPYPNVPETGYGS